MINRIVVLLLVGVYPSAAVAGISTMRGTEEAVWTDCSVVFAEVASVTEIDLGHVELSLHVRATLTGTYDAAANPVLDTELRYGGKISAILKPPIAKARVVVIVRRPRDRDGHLLNRYVIPSDIVTFMPNEAAMVEVKDFEDPRVRDVVTRLRQLRAPTTGAAKE